jgi:hypothetical protein
MAEDEEECGTIERARNRAIQWLEGLGVIFGPHRRIAIGRLGILEDKEVGVEADQTPYWRLRLDYDPDKQAHFNAEFGKGSVRKKRAFKFIGGEALIKKLAGKRTPRAPLRS